MQDNPTYEHFVYFTYKFEWKIADDYDPKGFLTIFLPKSFPLNLKPITAAIDKRSGFFESTIDACVDDFFIDCAIRNSFLHIVRYSKSNDLKSEKYTNENILLDAGVLFIPDRYEASITVQMQCFEYLTFTIQIDEELLTIPHIKKFAPTILYINKIDNFELDSVSDDPLYFECQIESNSYFLCPRYDRKQKVINIDVAIIIAPRVDQSIVFKVLDNCENIPEKFIGSGLFIPPNVDNNEEEECGIVRSISEEKLFYEQKKKVNSVKEIANTDEIKENNYKKSQTSSKRKKKKNNDVINALKKIENQQQKPVIQFVSPLKNMSNSNFNNSLISSTRAYLPSNSSLNNKMQTDFVVDANHLSAISKQEIQSTSVTPIKPDKLSVPICGYSQFYLFPERHANIKINSSLNDNRYHKATLIINIYDPASRFPPVEKLVPIKRPFVSHKRPPLRAKTNNKDQYFYEDPKILAIERPTTKLLRWIITCPRFSPISRRILDFIFNFHKATIHGFSHIKNQCFKNCYRKSTDIITGFHFLSPKEEVFILETRAYRPNKASLSLEVFLRDNIAQIKGSHIIANNSACFPAPRLYCCMETLIKRVEIPIVIEDLLQINGLYFQNHENHKLFSISQKLSCLLSSHVYSEILDSFPNYNDVKILEKKSASLSFIPIQKNLSTVHVVHAIGSDFGDFKEPTDQNIYNNINQTKNYQNIVLQPLHENKNSQPQTHGEKPKERLTNFYFTRPKAISQQNRNDSARSSKSSIHSFNNLPENYEGQNNWNAKDGRKSTAIRPPPDSGTQTRKAPRKRP